MMQASVFSAEFTTTCAMSDSAKHQTPGSEKPPFFRGSHAAENANVAPKTGTQNLAAMLSCRQSDGLASDPVASVIQLDGLGSRRENCPEAPKSVLESSSNGSFKICSEAVAAPIFGNTAADDAAGIKLRVDKGSGGYFRGVGGSLVDADTGCAVFSAADRSVSKQYNGQGGQTCEQDQMNIIKVNTQSEGLGRLSSGHPRSCPDLVSDQVSMCYHV
jgi:hypothetical protein